MGFLRGRIRTTNHIRAEQTNSGGAIVQTPWRQEGPGAPETPGIAQGTEFYLERPRQKWTSPVFVDINQLPV